MPTFEYVRAQSVEGAVEMVAGDPNASFLAGGTTHVDLLLKDAVIESSRLVDVTQLPLRGIDADGDALRVGALATMEALAAHPVVKERLPVLREALLAGASPQLRNMATIGGNLLQRTRCRYFRDRTVSECNKHIPGTGCAAVTRGARMHAILGASEECIALHPSDLCVALVALDAVVHTESKLGHRTLPLEKMHVTPGERPEIEHVLGRAELITQVDVPLLPDNARSRYLKVRDRASYEFALTSAAAALVVEGEEIADARLALGGVGTVPWRAREAEEILRGALPSRDLFRAAAEAAIRDTFTVAGTEFKVELAKRTIVRVLETLVGVHS